MTLYLFLVLLVTCLPIRPATGESTNTNTSVKGPLNYPLPGFSIKVLLLQQSFDQEAFLSELESVTSFHLDSNLRDQLPPSGLLSLDFYQSIPLTATVKSIERSNNTADGDRIVVETDFQGHCVFLPHQGAPPEHSTYLLKAMLSLLQLSFTTPLEYTRLVARYQATEILANIKYVQISIDNIDTGEQSDDIQYQPGTPVDTPPPPDTSSGQSMNAILIAIIVVVVILVLFCMVVFVYFFKIRGKKKKSRWSKSSRDLQRRSSSRRGMNGSDKDDMSNNSSFSSSVDATNDLWMDDMAKKMSRVSASKRPIKPKAPLLIARKSSSSKLGASRQSSLHCIVEESDSGSYSDASAISEDQRNFDMENATTALGPRDESSDTSDDELDCDLFMQETSDGSDSRQSMIAI